MNKELFAPLGDKPVYKAVRTSRLYEQIVQQIEESILKGALKPGDQLPAERELAQNFGGGQVDITNGKFVFSASEAYMIEDGKITAPIKGATLIGNGPDVLTRVSMVGNDLKLDEGVGTCGKDGQAVPVGVGIPTLKIDRMTVGGTARRETGGYMQ